MSFSTTDVYVDYQGNNITTLWPFPYAVLETTQILLYLRTSSTTEFMPVLTNFSVTLSSGGGANIQYPVSGTPITSSSTLRIIRKTISTQPTVLENQTRYFPGVIETALDRVMQRVQELEFYIGQSVRGPDYSTEMATLPEAVRRKGLYLRFNSTTGDPEAALLELGSLSGGVSTTYPITGDGVTVDFPLGEEPESVNHMAVFLSGVWQNRSTYSVSGSTVTFSAAPPDSVEGEIIVLRPLPLSSSGDSSTITHIQSGAGAVSRDLQSVLRGYLPTLEDFGGGTAVADNAAAFQAAMDAGGRLYVPEGRRYDIKSAITRSGSLMLVGGGSLVWTSDAASTGLTVSLTTTDNYSDRVIVHGTQFRTQKVAEGTALTIDGSAQVSGGVLQKRTFNRGAIVDAVFRGDTAPGTDGWLSHIDLQAVSNFDIERAFISGNITTDETTIASDYGVLIDDQGNGADIRISKLTVTYCDEAVSLDGCEGVNITQPVFVAVNTGVKAVNTNTGKFPGLYVQDGHINARLRGVDAADAQQILVRDMLFYQRQSATATGAAVYIVDCDDVSVDGCQFVGDYVNTGGVTYYGVLLGGTTTDAVVQGNHGQDVAYLAWAQVNTDNISFEDNKVSKEAIAAPAPGLYANTSSGRVVIDGEKFGGKNAGIVAAGSGTLVDVDLGTVHLGQKFLCSAKVAYTKGATGGFTTTAILKTSGTATVAFNYDDTELRFRSDQNATEEDIHMVTGQMEIAGEGTLVVRCQFTSSGSNATIAAGEAQLSIVQIGTSGRLS